MHREGNIHTSTGNWSPWADTTAAQTTPGISCCVARSPRQAPASQDLRCWFPHWSPRCQSVPKYAFLCISPALHFPNLVQYPGPSQKCWVQLSPALRGGSVTGGVISASGPKTKNETTSLLPVPTRSQSGISGAERRGPMGAGLQVGEDLLFVPSWAQLLQANMAMATACQAPDVLGAQVMGCLWEPL